MTAPFEAGEELVETVARAIADAERAHGPFYFPCKCGWEAAFGAGWEDRGDRHRLMSIAAAAIAALPPSPAEEAVKRVEALRAVWTRDGCHVVPYKNLRAALASPAPGCTCDRVDQPATYHFQGCPAVYPSAPHDKQGQRREDGLPDDCIDADWTYYS